MYCIETELGLAPEQLQAIHWKTQSYVSRFLDKAELKGSLTELKLIAVVRAINHYQIYLFGARLKF